MVNDQYVVSLQVLDLASGDISPVFNTPVNAWIDYFSVSPNSQQLVISYVLPGPDGSPAYPALYTMPLDGSTPPQLLFNPPGKNDAYIQAEWSPDGKYIYYTHVDEGSWAASQINPAYEILRMVYPNGRPELIARNAYWPRLSSDGSRLVYVLVDPFLARNKLRVANPDGSDVRKVTLTGIALPNIIDAPLFSPDGRSILFSAAPQGLSHKPGWLQTVLGIQNVKADGIIPSDWWSVPITGGKPMQITDIQSIGLFASVSPDRKHIAVSSGAGLAIMNPDGSDLTQLLPNAEIISSTVSWIP